MLIEFNVKNFRSIRDGQTFSMAANSKTELQETNTFSTGIKSLPRLLRSAIMYTVLTPPVKATSFLRSTLCSFLFELTGSTARSAYPCHPVPVEC